MGNLRRAIAVAVIAAFLPLSTVGCFGKFELTKKLYRYNEDFNEDKWMQEVLFLVLSFFYGGAIVLDAIVFNSLEFWTGKNPVLASNGATQTVTDAEGRHITMTRVDADTLSITVAEVDGVSQDLVLVREDRAISAWDTDGKLLTRVAHDGIGPPAVATQ
jgi:hypothetical protein